jgi:hypothetical protein
MTKAPMNSLFKVSYALQRQQRAVERTLYASSAEESALASKWVGAWHRLVQARLDRMAEAGGENTRVLRASEFGGAMSRSSRYVDGRGRLLH